jgi:outer membrane biosynthesis protein TonB
MATKLPTNNAFEDFLLSPKGDKLIRFNISRNTLIAFAISLLIHAIILFFVVPKIQMEKIEEPTTFEVVLAQPEIKPEPLPQEPMPERLSEPVSEVKPIEKPKVITQKPNKNAKPPVFSVPEVLTTEKSMPEKVEKPPETDMFAALNAKRAAREQGESEAAKINAEAVAREIGPSEDEKRDTRIKNNLKVGTNGIFEIKRLDSNSASFSFRGWTDNAANAKLEYFEVEAKGGEDVRMLMIRRMIALIRVHYQGDFDWESHRLGRTIIKSARVEDSAELEDFLMQEFFGRYYKTQ